MKDLYLNKDIENDDFITYYISTEGKDKKDLYLGSFIKSKNPQCNNILHLYTNCNFKFNAKILHGMYNVISMNFGDVDFTIMTSEIFNQWEDKHRYITDNLI